MEKKNTVLLTVIAVATLLVAVVGATFAYFTASNSTSGDAAGSVDVTTAAESVSLQLNVNKVTGSNNMFYPGTKNFVGATASAQFKDDTPSADGKEYKITYALSGNITLGAVFDSDIKWALYETTSEVTSPVTCGAITPYTPAGEGATAVEGSKTQSCTLATALTDSAKVKSGTISSGTTTAAITHSGEVQTNGAVAGTPKYYYLVVELPETGTDQTTDATGKSVTIAIDKIEQTGSTPVTP